MIKVYVRKTSNYPVSAPKLKKRLVKYLRKKGIVSDCLVNISLVGEKKMKSIAKDYLKDEKVHNVLSFTESEMKSEFVYPPDTMIHLGEIVVCYPKATEEANKQGILIEERVHELVEHGARHLMGEHHN